ncbi:MAG: hypothetical protein ABJA85_01880 [Bacteroidota bacterium]
MTKFIALAIIALRIVYNPSHTETGIAPFASPPPTLASTITTPARFISITGSISKNKIILNWVVSENETADQFAVEKSIDGKNFNLAAIIFGTDKAETDNYQFYEKAGKQKVLYRIKLITKNMKTEYSTIVEINPNA